MRSIAIATGVLAAILAGLAALFWNRDLDETRRLMLAESHHCPAGTTERIERAGETGWLRLCMKRELRHRPTLPSHRGGGSGRVPGRLAQGVVAVGGIVRSRAESGGGRTGENRHLKQSGSVWFLAGTYGTTRTIRKCTVPHRLDGLRAYRQATPDCLDMGALAQPRYRIFPSAANGYYVMLRPLPPERHELNFGGRLPGLIQAVTHTLLVE